MAQKTNGASGSRSNQKSSSGARKPAQSGASRSGGSGSHSRAQAAKSSARDAATKNSRSATPTPSEPAAVKMSTARRAVGAFVLLFLAMVAFLCYFPIEAWLVDILRVGCRGLFGWGFYIMCPSFLLGAIALGFHKNRPVTLRVVSALLLPLMFGGFVHVAFGGWAGDLTKDFEAGVKDLWNSGLLSQTRCGGVLSGTLAELLELTISVYGGAVVFGVSLVGLLMAALRLSPRRIEELWNERPKLKPLSAEEYELGDEFEPLESFEPNRKEREKLRKSPSFQMLEPAPEVRYPLQETATTARKRADGESKAPWEKDELWEGRPQRQKKSEKASRPELFDAEKEDRMFEALAREKLARGKTDTAAQSAAASESEDDGIAETELQSAEMDGPAAPKPKKLKIDKDAEAAKVAAEIEAAEEPPEYNYPPVTLLKKGKVSRDDSRDETEKNRERLESTMHSFGVSARIVGVTRGPTVTRFDLELAQGVKQSKIINLAGDIALTLGVKSVRIAPVPDTPSTMGVEVPNRKTSMVVLRDIIESEAFQNAKSSLSVAVGRDISGNAVVDNIEKLPHLLVAGTTGSGKSVFINSLILSILYKSGPEDVRFIMVDPKMVELGIYNGMPHLYVPVVTDPKKAAGALQWSVVEMERRFCMLEECGVRDLESYNNVMRRRGEPTMPRIVIIIDELADLMMVASKEVEISICRVAQKGRAAGLHLVVATQRPSADVITGLIKSNVPGRAAFTVASAMESRIILDAMGAEKLLGNGDLIYSPKPNDRVRVQSAFVSDEEREAIVRFVKKDAEADYSDEIMEEIERAVADRKDKGGRADSDADESGLDGFDELLPQAVDVVLDMKQASTSSLQRKLRLGYSRAARIMDQMEELGVVGPSEGSKPRKLLITRSQWQEMQYGTGVAPADRIVPDGEDDIAFAATADESEDEEF